MDSLTPEKRSWNMSRIRSRDTKPEIAVRSLLHRMGYRFRLHSQLLPGRPDIVLPRYRTVIFVHGCYWHRHKGCRYAYTPKSRVDFWTGKFSENVERDQRREHELRALGWNVLIVWECETRNMEGIERRIIREFNGLEKDQSMRNYQ
jgi:DNA mismatch endonuclease (patch repair protein)